MKRVLFAIMIFVPYLVNAQIKIATPQDEEQESNDFKITDIMYAFDLHDYNQMYATGCTFNPEQYYMKGQRLLLLRLKWNYGKFLKIKTDGSQEFVDSLPTPAYYTIGRYLITAEEQKQFNDSISALHRICTRKNSTISDYKKYLKAKGIKMNANEVEAAYKKLPYTAIPLTDNEFADIKNVYDLNKNSSEQRNERYNSIAKDMVIQLVAEDKTEYYVHSSLFGNGLNSYIVESFWNEYIQPLKGQKVHMCTDNGLRYYSHDETQYKKIQNVTFDYVCVDVSVNPIAKDEREISGIFHPATSQPYFVATLQAPDGTKKTETCSYSDEMSFGKEIVGISPHEFYSEGNYEEFMNAISPEMDKYFAEKHAQEAKEKAEAEKNEKQFEQEYAQYKQERLKKLTAKFGAKYAKSILDGKFEVGMTEAMCNAITGIRGRKALYIGEHKEVYRYYNLIFTDYYTDVTFVDNKVTKVVKGSRQ